MRIVVTGGRDYRDASAVDRALHAVYRKHNITAIIHGGASGADMLCAQWAERQLIPVEVFPADWSHGKCAGPMRNERMLVDGKPDACIAFPGGRGTADMTRRVRLAGLPIWQIERK